VTTIVHRRYLPPREAEGPGSRLAALSLVGWASLGFALAFLVLAWRFVLDIGPPRSVDVQSLLANLVQGTLAPALVALPAALEWGVPGARRRVPRLWRGAVLLALAAALRVGLGWVQDELGRRGEDLGMSLLEDPAYSVFALAGLALVALRLAGWWGIARGLADAGARVSPVGVAAALVVGALPALVSLAQAIAWAVSSPMRDSVGASSMATIGPIQVVGVLVAAAVDAFTVLAAARLVAGARSGLAPRVAWVLGALAGVLLIAEQVVYLATTLGLLPGVAAMVVASWTVAYAPPVLLLAAFALGLGRGRWRQAPFVPGYRRAQAAR
jgi:hypothetical protein